MSSQPQLVAQDFSTAATEAARKLHTDAAGLGREIEGIFGGVFGRVWQYAPTIVRERPFAALFVTSAFFGIAVGAFALSMAAARPAFAGVEAPVSMVAEQSSMVEMHIAPTGLVLLRNAQVQSVSSSQLLVRTLWGGADFTWLVTTNGQDYGARHFGTRVLNHDGKTISLANVHVGDTITINGTLQSDTSQLTVEASTIRTVD